MELIIILIIFVTAFVIAVNTRKKHVSMENNVSPNNIPCLLYTSDAADE